MTETNVCKTCKGKPYVGLSKGWPRCNGTGEEQEGEKTPATPEFVRWEEVEVSDKDDFTCSRFGKFVCTIDHEYKYLAEVNWRILMWWKHMRKPQKQEAWPKKFTKEQIYLAYTNARKGNVRSLDDILDGILSELDMLEK